VIDLGPDGGKDGGYLVGQGTPEELAKVKGSWTGKYLKEKLSKE
jgi:excinuclease ABC subunit A